MARAPRTARRGSGRPATPVDRRREVLEAALELIAERGYAGASLRVLAQRVGMQQPSLYHYFRTKEELIEQILATFSADMLAIGGAAPPSTLDEVPQWIRDRVIALYETRTHPLFVRVMFQVSRLHPRYGRLMREFFVDRVDEAMRAFAMPFVERGEIDADSVVFAGRLAVNALGLRLMEERVLFDDRPLSPSVYAYADFVVEAMRALLRQFARPPARPRASRTRRR